MSIGKNKKARKIISTFLSLLMLLSSAYADSIISIGTGDIGSGGGSGNIPLVSANPSSGYTGDTLNVLIEGAETHFDSTSNIDFGSDITVNSVSVIDSTHLLASISIKTSAVLGNRTVTVTTGSETASGAIFTVNQSSVALSPSIVNQGWAGNVVISGSGTHFISGNTSISFAGSGIILNSFVVNSTNEAIANITVLPNATISARETTILTDLGALGSEMIYSNLFVSSLTSGLVIDDFEYYANRDSRGMMDYYYQSGSNPNEVIIPNLENSTTIFEEGYRSIKVKYSGADGSKWGGYWGGGLNSDTKDLTPYNGISLWVKGDGTNNTFSISLIEADVNGVTQETYSSPSYSLADTNWHKIDIPFTAFVRDPYGNQLEGVFSKVIKGYSIVYRGAQTSSSDHYVDYIVAGNINFSGDIPSVSSVTPNSGLNTSTTNVSISGTNFDGITSVKIGTWPVSSYTVNSLTSISAVIPSGLPVGTYYITVSNAFGSSSQTPQSQFTVLQGNIGDILIDNFEENYKTDERGQMDYYFNSGSQAGEVSIPNPVNSITNVYEGVKSMQITYPGASGTNWGGYWGGGLLNPANDAIDISSANMLVYHVKGDGSNNTNRISISEYKNGSQDESFRSLDSFTLSNNTAFKEIKVPFTRMWRDEYTGAMKDDNVFSGKVKSYTLVYTGGENSSSPHFVDYIKAVNWTGPIIDLIGPNFGPVGITVEVIGRNFGQNQGSSTITLNGQISPVNSWSDNRIVMVVPNGATSGLIEVTVNGQISNGVPFAVTGINPSGPRINMISPSSGPVGTTVTISGSGFSSDPGENNRSTATNHITIGTYRITTGNVLSWSDTSIVVRIPNIADGVYPVQIRSNDKESNFVNFTVISSSLDTIPPSQVFGNAMRKIGNDLILEWEPATDNVGVTGYNIYRSNNPEFVPSSANKIGTSQTTSFTDVGVLSSPETYYYKIKAFDAAGNESVNPSNIGYKLNKIVPFNTAKSNVFWISIPNISPYKKAIDIATDIPYATKVSRFDPNSQSYKNLEKFLGNWIGDNFDVITGESYAVVVGAASEAKLVGWYYPYTINMPYSQSASNVYWISIPYNSVYSKVSDLAQSIPNATKISRFNPDIQDYERWEKFLGSWSGTNFDIVPGEGYGIVVNSNTLWLPNVKN